MTERGHRSIDIADLPALLLFAALGVVVLLQFVTRYVLNDSLAWTEEVARYLLIGVVYVGSASAIRKGEHIFLEVTYRLAPLKNVKPLALMADAITVVFHLILTGFAFHLASVADRRMISVDLPKSIVYSVVAVALLAGCVFAMRRPFNRLRQSTEDIIAEIDAASVDNEAGC